MFVEENKVALDYESTLFEGLVPKFRYDGSIPREGWKKRMYQRLWDLLGLDNFRRPADSKFEYVKEFEINGVAVQEFAFQSEEGYVVPGYIARPIGAGDKKLPVCLCLQGHSSGMHNSLSMEPDYTPKTGDDLKEIVEKDRAFMLRAVQEGYAAVCIEQRYMGRRGTYKERPGCSGLYSMAALLIGRCAIGERVWDTMRLIDELEKIETLDTANLVCMGNSGGGTATFYVSCIDERIKYSMPSCAFCTYKDSIVDIRHCACNYIPGIALDFDMGDLAGLIAGRSLVVVNGINDKIFPDFGVRKAYAEAEKAFADLGGNIALITGDGGHRFYADMAWPKLHEFERKNGVR